MKKIIFCALLAVFTLARAQFVPFVPNQKLTAEQLNAAFGQFVTASGGVFTGPITAPSATFGTPLGVSSGGTGGGAPAVARANLGVSTNATVCDLLASGCASAWSVTRKLKASYSGSLFNVYRASDATTLDIGVNAFGLVDLPTLSVFCAGTQCFVDRIYDQGGSNNMAQATPASMPFLVIGDGNALPYIQTTETSAASSTWLEQQATSGLPTGGVSKSLFEVSRINWSRCCGGFGMTENPPGTLIGGGGPFPGQMFSFAYLGYASQFITPASWNFGIDIEQGYTQAAIAPFEGIAYASAEYSSASNTVSAQLNGTQVVSGAHPTQVINTGSRVTIGSAGDTTPVPTMFYEGYIAAEAATNTEIASVYSNQTSFYGGQTNGTATQLNVVADNQVAGVLSGPFSEVDLALVNTSPAGHDWRIQSNGTGAGSFVGPGGVSFFDATGNFTWFGITSAGAATFRGALNAIAGFNTTGTITGTNASGQQFVANDSSGTTHSDYYFFNAGVQAWAWRNQDPANAFQLVRYVAGVLQDSPVQVANATGIVTLSDGLVVQGTAVRPNLSGTTGSIGGGALIAGACASGTVAVASSTTAMAVSVSPVTYPGDGFWWEGYVSAAGTVTLKVCAAVAGTPTASAYNVRVLQ